MKNDPTHTETESKKQQQQQQQRCTDETELVRVMKTTDILLVVFIHIVHRLCNIFIYLYVELMEGLVCYAFRTHSTQYREEKKKRTHFGHDSDDEAWNADDLFFLVIY